MSNPADKDRQEKGVAAEGHGLEAESSQLSLAELASRMGSATAAVLGVLALPVVLGIWLDQLLGGIVGFIGGLIVGMIASCIVLIRLAQKLTPVARRSARELNDEDLRTDIESEDQKVRGQR